MGPISPIGDKSSQDNDLPLHLYPKGLESLKVHLDLEHLRLKIYVITVT